MKKLIYIIPMCLAGLFSLPVLKAQSQWVATFSYIPQHSPEGHHIYANRAEPVNEFTFNLDQVKASFIIGGGRRFSFSPFFIQTEAQYTRQEYTYDVEYTYPEFIRSAEVLNYKETTHLLYLPVSLGVDLGLVEFSSGFTPQVVLGQDTDLDQIAGFSSEKDALRFSWQTGLAAKLANFRLGINWQMDFNRYADHMSVNGESLALKGNPSRVVASATCLF